MGELVEITKQDIYPNNSVNDGKIVFGKNDNQKVIYSISDLSEEEYDSENYIESFCNMKIYLKSNQNTNILLTRIKVKLTR